MIAWETDFDFDDCSVPLALVFCASLSARARRFVSAWTTLPARRASSGTRRRWESVNPDIGGVFSDAVTSAEVDVDARGVRSCAVHIVRALGV